MSNGFKRFRLPFDGRLPGPSDARGAKKKRARNGAVPAMRKRVCLNGTAIQRSRDTLLC